MAGNAAAVVPVNHSDGGHIVTQDAPPLTYNNAGGTAHEHPRIRLHEAQHVFHNSHTTHFPGEFMKKLGIDEMQDGGKGSKTINNLEYGWSLSSTIGFWFYVTKP